jgi:hypothetical protein
MHYILSVFFLLMMRELNPTLSTRWTKEISRYIVLFNFYLVNKIRYLDRIIKLSLDEAKFIQAMEKSVVRTLTPGSSAIDCEMIRSLLVQLRHATGALVLCERLKRRDTKEDEPEARLAASYVAVGFSRLAASRSVGAGKEGRKLQQAERGPLRYCLVFDD